MTITAYGTICRARRVACTRRWRGTKVEATPGGGANFVRKALMV